jgi:hypothetical protein
MRYAWCGACGAASANQDRGEIFGSVGVSPTRFTWAYDVADDADVEVVLDAVAGVVVALGPPSTAENRCVGGCPRRRKAIVSTSSCW